MIEWFKTFAFYMAACLSACFIVVLSGVALWWLAFIFVEGIGWIAASIGVVSALFSAALAFAEMKGWD